MQIGRAGGFMPKLGFSAFVKLLCLNPRPRRSEVLKRRRPRNGGYDFHRSLKLHAERLLSGEVTLPEALEAAGLIIKTAERESCSNGLRQLNDWRTRNPAEFFIPPPTTFDSPNGLFSIFYAPDFGVLIDDQRVAVHIWNNIRPELEDRFVYAALFLISTTYEEPRAVDDVAMLSLRDGTFYRLGEGGDHSVLADLSVTMVERLFEEVDEELKVPDRRREGPTAPPPAP